MRANSFLPVLFPTWPELNSSGGSDNFPHCDAVLPAGPALAQGACSASPRHQQAARTIYGEDGDWQGALTWVARALTRRTCFPGSVSGTCRAGSRFPRPHPFAPPTPRPLTRTRSPASTLLWMGLTSPGRASSAPALTAFPMRTAGQAVGGRPRDLPVPWRGVCAHAGVMDRAGPPGHSRLRAPSYGLPLSERRRRPD
jgi:hypothetical protein